MMSTNLATVFRRPLSIVGGLALLLSSASALAQSTNFAAITLSAYPPTTDSVEGRTVGAYALSNIASSDLRGNLCTGYGDVNPDHTLTLESEFPSLTITVNSGQDTTLLIQGPEDSTIYCGQDISRRNLDAAITGSGWEAGTYRIWVGAHDQGQRFNYTLTVTE